MEVVNEPIEPPSPTLNSPNAKPVMDDQEEAVGVKAVAANEQESLAHSLSAPSQLEREEEEAQVVATQQSSSLPSPVPLLSAECSNSPPAAPPSPIAENVDPVESSSARSSTSDSDITDRSSAEREESEDDEGLCRDVQGQAVSSSLNTTFVKDADKAGRRSEDGSDPYPGSDLDSSADVPTAPDEKRVDDERTLHSSNAAVDVSADSSVLDLSSRSLAALPTIPDAQRERVAKLVISKNSFKSVSLTKFSALIEVDASENQLHRFSCFLPVAKTLQWLNASRNEITGCDILYRITALRYLDASYNKIERMPILDQLVHLTTLKLVGNHLLGLPPVLCLVSLKSLDLTSNLIATLDNAEKALPKGLTELCLASNKVDDISEALYLVKPCGNLVVLTFAGNPCVDCIDYDYRPYLISCCVNLKSLDGFRVIEDEYLKGEWLYSLGKARSFAPGSGERLTAYLRHECPIGRRSSQERAQSSLSDTQLRKVLLQRQQLQQHQQQTGLEERLEEVVSVSPRARPMSELSLEACKENRVPSASEPGSEASSRPATALTSSCSVPIGSSSSNSGRCFSSATPKQSGSATPVPGVVGDVVVNPYEAYDNRPARSSLTGASPSRPISSNFSPSKQSSLNRTVTVAVARSSGHRNIAATSPHRRTANAIISSTQKKSRAPVGRLDNVNELSFSSTTPVSDIRAERMPETPPSVVSAGRGLPVYSAGRFTLKQVSSATKIQAWWRGVQCRMRNRQSIFELRATRADQHIQLLKSQMTEMRLEQNKLREINVQLLNIVEHVTQMQLEDRTEFAALKAACLPVPVNLQCQNRDHNSVLLKWDLQPPVLKVEGYSLLLDGRVCGRVSGKRCSALIQDMDLSLPHQISVQVHHSSALENSSSAPMISAHVATEVLRNSQPNP